MDSANCVQQTSDGGYIVAGQLKSYGAGGWDFWGFKLNKSGEMVWERTFGGAYEDAAWSVVESLDHKGYVFAGYTTSFGAGLQDIWVIKLNNNGEEVWSKLFGGSSRDMAMFIEGTSDGGYAVAGESGGRMMVLKLDQDGNLVWNKIYTYGRGRYLKQTADHGYIFTGYSGSTSSSMVDRYAKVRSLLAMLILRRPMTADMFCLGLLNLWARERWISGW